MNYDAQPTYEILTSPKALDSYASSAGAFDNRPIGVFDSGFGGLTVASEIIATLPNESIVYLGDSGRCPYGPRSLTQVDGFVQQISRWLLTQDVKMIVIACNTATAAGLAHAQESFSVPVLGVINPGARAAQTASENKRIGVIATQATVDSGAYTHAIRALDEEITVFSTATPRFVEIAEQGVRMAQGPIESFTAQASKVYIRPAFQEIARDYLEPLKRCDIDTLVLGCTHFPLLKTLIGSIIGDQVKLINSAYEVAKDVQGILQARSQLACENNQAQYRFYTTGRDVEEFQDFGSRVLNFPMETVNYLRLEEDE